MAFFFRRKSTMSVSGAPVIGAVLLAAQLCGRGTRGPKRLGLGGNDLREPDVMGEDGEI